MIFDRTNLKLILLFFGTIVQYFNTSKKWSKLIIDDTNILRFIKKNQRQCYEASATQLVKFNFEILWFNHNIIYTGIRLDKEMMMMMFCGGFAYSSLIHNQR